MAKMNLFKFAVIFYVGLHMSIANGAPLCTSVLKNETAIQPLLKVDSRISTDQSKLIAEVVAKVSTITTLSQRPINVSVEVLDNPRAKGAEAILHKDTITLSTAALRLTPGAFKALIAHEYTHLIVVRNFKGQSGTSVFETLVKHDGNFEYAIGHLSFAELLCDTMSVLLSRNPKAITELVAEISANDIRDHKLNSEADSTSIDSPLELSARDFSVPIHDPRWQTYKPNDLVYNRFNQIRSYLWSKWIYKLAPEKNAAFYLKLQSALADVYKSGRLDQITSMDGVPNSNKLLIEYLDQSLNQIL